MDNRCPLQQALVELLSQQEPRYEVDAGTPAKKAYLASASPAATNRRVTESGE